VHAAQRSPSHRRQWLRAARRIRVRLDGVVAEARVDTSSDTIIAAAGRMPEATIEQIARAAGVSPATVYRKFVDREGLMQQVAARRVVDGLRPVVATGVRDDDPMAGLWQIARGLISLAAASTAETRHESSAVYTVLRAVLDAYVHDIDGLVARAQERGQIRDDIDPEDSSRIIGMMVAGMVLPFPAAEDPERYIALVFDAARPGAPPLPPHRSSSRRRSLPTVGATS
jgi:AcrR family transcriptional regulator